MCIIHARHSLSIYGKHKVGSKVFMLITPDLELWPIKDEAVTRSCDECGTS